MDNTKLLNAIQEAESNSDKPELGEDRQKALRYYSGELDITAPAGRSSFVSRDVHNAIEGIKPSLLKIFASTDEVCQFNPMGAEDVDAAEQESSFVNYIFSQKNDGFLTLEQWFHDALLLRNGYVKVFWDASESVETERYDALTPEALTMLAQDKSVEVLSYEVDEVSGLYSVELRTKKEYGCVKVINLPPEQTLVSHNCPSVNVGESEFFEHWDYKSISWLRENGFDVSDDISDEAVESIEEATRNTLSRSENYGDDLNNDPALRLVKVRECWIRHDANGDGKAELLHCIVVGNEILLSEDADEIPVACISPYPMPHRHIGRSVADDAIHYQEVKSYLWRGYIDNLALVNNGRYAISDKVNLSDMLQSRPGGVVRVTGSTPGNEIFPLVHPAQGGQIIQGIEFLQSGEENDTGVTRYNQGADANSLNKTATGISRIMNAAQMRIDLIARNFAETGVKRLMWLIHKTAKQNYTQPEVYRLRNKWVEVDPRSWKTRYDLSISVGLGTGDKEQQLVHLQSILMAQKEAMQIGVATPKNIYHSLTKLTENAGFKDIENFWTDPESPDNQPAPPQPDPETIKAQADAQKFQAQQQADMQKFQAETELKAMEAQRETEREAMRLEFEKWKVEYQEQMKFAIAELNAQNSVKTTAMTINSGNAQAITELDDEGFERPISPFADLVHAINQNMAAVAQAQSEHSERIMEALSRPKTVVRDPKTNRVIGVQ